jgi:hypothetical protein
MRIKLELDLKFKIYLEKEDVNKIMLLYDDRDDDEHLSHEFPKSEYQIEIIKLSGWIANCFHFGLPFNNYYL